MDIDLIRVLDSVDQYIFCKNKMGVYTYVNEPFVGISGFRSREDVVGKTDREMAWKKQADHYESSDLDVLNGKSIIRQEQVQLREDGTARIMMTKKPYISNDGNVIGIVGSFFDCQDHLILEAKGDFCEEKKRLYLEFVPEWLSYAEIRICFYLIQGFSAPKIADKSGIAVSTVRYHIENIKNKLQCNNKSEIPEVAMRTGIAWKIMSLQHVSDTE
jgi:PAS domain S-box-containing protein